MAQARRYYKCQQRARRWRLQRERAPLQHDQDWAQWHLQAGEYGAPEVGCAETIPADGSFVRNGLVYSAAELILNGWPTPPVPFRLISTQSL